MLTRLTIELSEKERAALQRQAERDLRGLREQARYLIIRGLASEIAEQVENSNETAAHSAGGARNAQAA